MREILSVLFLCIQFNCFSQLLLDVKTISNDWENNIFLSGTSKNNLFTNVKNYNLSEIDSLRLYFTPRQLLVDALNDHNIFFTTEEVTQEQKTLLLNYAKHNSDWVVTESNDTIYGFVSRKSKYFIVNQFEISDPLRIIQDSIISYSAGDKVYEKADEKKYAKMVYKGEKINLYSYFWSSSFDDETLWYVRKPDEASIKSIKGLYVSKSEFRDSAMKYFSDCPKIVSKILNKEFKRKNVYDMVVYYDKECPNY